MADQVHLEWSCTYCSQCFSTQDEFRNHIETERLRVADLIEQLRIAFLHSSSHYSTHIANDSHHKTLDDSDGSASEDESNKHDGLGGNSSIDQSNKRACLRCPFPSCNGEETYTKKPNMLRHYQTHIECNEKCAFCGKPFNRLRKLVKHLEDCKVKKNQDKQGVSPNSMQYLALRRKDELCKLALKQMDQQMNQKMGSKKGQKRRKDSTPKEIAQCIGDDDDSSAEESPATPAEQMSSPQAQLSVRKRRCTEQTTNSENGRHTLNPGAYHGSSSELDLLLAAAQSSDRSLSGENGNVGGPAAYPAIANTRSRLYFYHPKYRPPGHSQVATQYAVPAHAGVPVSYHTMSEPPSYGQVSSQCPATIHGSSSVSPYNTISNNYTNLNFEEVNTPFLSTPGGSSIETVELPPGIYASS